MTVLNEKFFLKFLKNTVGDKSVALVGNSPILLNSKQGNQIDSHDCVIRMNDGPVEGYELDVGERCDVRFWGCTMEKRHVHFLNDNDSKERRERYVSKYKNAKTYSFRDKDVLYSFNLHLRSLQKLSELGVDFHIKEFAQPPRSGLAILIYLILCKPLKINVYGFEKNFRDKGLHNFFEEEKEIGKMLRSWSKYHIPLDLEMHIVNLLDDKFDCLVFN